MKRLLLAFAAMTLFITAVCAQQHGTVAKAEPAAAKWFIYTSPDGRYSVSLTQPPKLSTQNIEAASGDTLVHHMAGASADPAYLMVGYFDYPETVTFSLDAARDAMVNSLQGRLLNEESISVGGGPGRAIKIAIKTDAGDLINRVHLYDIERRIYILQCLMPANQGPSAVHICDQFFDSFRVKTN